MKEIKREVVYDAFGNPVKVGDTIVYAEIGKRKSIYEGKVRLYKAIVHIITAKTRMSGDVQTHILVERTYGAPTNITKWLIEPTFIIYREPVTESDSS